MANVLQESYNNCIIYFIWDYYLSFHKYATYFREYLNLNISYKTQKNDWWCMWIKIFFLDSYVLKTF